VKALLSISIFSVFIFQFSVFYLLNYSLVWFAIIKSVVCCIEGVVLKELY
jgi:hypothetical protein